ncbi:flagellar protein FliT [Paraburkholderia sp. RL18-103-BIB-C]|uniref:flagellar protein FliT n=1 Tax=Paraburkholderia sp. RL18-103-BIB-C TaxID=3031637 RepID=UPI0038B96473
MEFATRIDRIWQLTKSIEQATAVGEWERAAELASERSPLLMSLSAQQAGAGLDVLAQVHAIDARIAAEAQLAQTELGAEYRAAMQAASHANQYQRVAQF